MAYVIDAQGKMLGRVASEAAHVLMGKHKATFVKNAVVGEEVEIKNAKGIVISGTKARTKQYERYSGYPSGLKFESYEHLVARRGHKEAIRNAIYGMLPGNKLRPRRMKLLTIEE